MKVTTKVVKNPGRELETGEEIGSAALSKNPKAAFSSIPDTNFCYRSGKGLYLGKFA